jgi:hypothetical protein
LTSVIMKLKAYKGSLLLGSPAGPFDCSVPSGVDRIRLRAVGKGLKRWLVPKGKGM